jgi:hypothetical protein
MYYLLPSWIMILTIGGILWIWFKLDTLSLTYFSIWLLVHGHVQCDLLERLSKIKFVNDAIYWQNIIGYVMNGKSCF